MIKKILLSIMLFAVSARSAGSADRRLDVWYAGFNHEYFNDELPRDVIITRTLNNDDFMAVTFYDNNQYHIMINPKYNLSTKTERINILHESCHILIFVEHDEEFDDHGPHWQQCMHKLSQQGAFEALW